RKLAERGELKHEEQDEPDGAERPDAAVTHDGETLRRIMAGEPIQTVGQAVEMQAARQELPCRHRQDCGEKRRKYAECDGVDCRQRQAQPEADDRKPWGSAAEVLEAGVPATGDGEDREVPDRQQGARHAADASTLQEIYSRARSCLTRP